MYVPKISKNLISISSPTTQNNLDIIFTNGACILKDRLGKVMLRRIDKSGLFEMKWVNKVNMQRDRHEAASSYSSLFASLKEFVDLGSKESVKLESNPLIHSCVESESVVKNVGQLDIQHRRTGHPNERALIKVLSNCNDSYESIR